MAWVEVAFVKGRYYVAVEVDATNLLTAPAVCAF